MRILTTLNRERDSVQYELSSRKNLQPWSNIESSHSTRDPQTLLIMHCRFKENGTSMSDSVASNQRVVRLQKRPWITRSQSNRENTNAYSWSLPIKPQTRSSLRSSWPIFFSSVKATPPLEFSSSPKQTIRDICKCLRKSVISFARLSPN